ncbi:MAG: serine/threonine-protein kinase [Polyangiaceae bacterium]
MTELPHVDGFRFVEELGTGSVSSVYRAVEESTGRTVAVKILLPTASPSSPLAAELEHEARVLAGLCHPNVRALFRFEKSADRMFAVLEYVDGLSLSALLQRKGRILPDSVAAIGSAAARGLAYVHECGLVHRDIKPSSVLLGRRGEVKLVAFGLAQKAVDPQDAAANALRVGRRDPSTFRTPAYMSPEQILGEAVDARSDIFSLGVVLYQAICGARPFDRSDERPFAQRIRRDPPIPLHRRAPEVPRGLELVIMRAIEKLPANRLQSAVELAEQLERLLAPRSGLRGDGLVVRALADAGFATQTQTLEPAPSAPSERAPVRRAAAGLAMLGVVSVVGGGFLQTRARHDNQASGDRPLALVPHSPGFLRVLATPWAEVWVDGERLDVTPFARRIPLEPGTHYVTLTHPSATVEKRTVSIAPGEIRTLDVVMAVRDSPSDQDAGAVAAVATHDR